jgi:diguanylate cyclase (GGDEF)-like protein
MNLDIHTLFILNIANVGVVAVIFPLIMGSHLSVSARAARSSLIATALGWGMLAASAVWTEGSWQDRMVSTAGMSCFCAGQWLAYTALRGWLGPRPWPRLLGTLCILMPLGYGVAYDYYGVRVAWSTFLLAAQMLIIARAALWPRLAMQGNWRWVVAVGSVVLAVFNAGRGVLGGFTDLYPSFLTPHPWNIASLLVANLATVMMNVAMLIGWHEESDLELRNQAITDPLTGILNRRGWNGIAGTLVAQANRQGLPLALLTIDLDHFKKINDVYGHAAGDRALQYFGELLSEGRRASDVIARLGGEEFGVLLPMADEAAARNLDQRLRLAISEEAESALGFGLNFSSGLALLAVPNETQAELMARSDAALYAAKLRGRGRMVIAGGEAVAVADVAAVA